eukprot:CAMPEP_0115524706 /NCGR_PEP_ID=MMETSP0271-20121206/81332_1 /TAXON_ID=71861 /ORGANISM="Scrippsiella trochoidea, Strain CCMP3099" /LENGTH=62 /DNA_ID=CAMNT_0002956241 /DNA_START=15 /DNA_END=199 /DNA_ORIENTATION=+
MSTVIDHKMKPLIEQQANTTSKLCELESNMVTKATVSEMIAEELKKQQPPPPDPWSESSRKR